MEPRQRFLPSPSSLPSCREDRCFITPGSGSQSGHRFIVGNAFADSSVGLGCACPRSARAPRRMLLPPCITRLWLLLLAVSRPALPAPTELALPAAQCLGQSCYAIFWTPKRFLGAQRMCDKMADNGHLMTVRSSVSADVISLLLLSTGEQGSTLWIGLQRAPARPCPDPSQQLRGFQWVTGDNRTDYTNWLGPGGAGCGAQCAAVRSDLTWEERDCEARSPGFLCEFTYPATCRPLSLDPGYTANYNTPFNVEGSDFMDLPPDTIASVSPLSLKLQCRGDATAGGSWVPLGRDRGPWDCQVENGGCRHICQGEGGTGSCLCPPDLELAEDGRGCAPPCARRGCEHLCFLNSTDNVPQCMCHEGFELGADGTSCQDIDDCQVNKAICDQGCRNTVGSYECTCNLGYEMVDGTCKDIDECENQVCEQDCINLNGTYRCDCGEGYIPDPKDPSKCQMFCGASECPAECDPHSEDSCRCPSGYLLTNTEDNRARVLDFDEGTPNNVCVDVDECNFDYCDQMCDNAPGSFRCSCGNGYILQEDHLSCKPAGEEVVTTTTATAGTTTAPPQAMHLGVMIGIAVGILSMVIIIVAIGLHLIRKHTVHSVMDYKCKHKQKEVVLQQVTLGSSSHQKL